MTIFWIITGGGGGTNEVVHYQNLAAGVLLVSQVFNWVELQYTYFTGKDLI